MIVSEAASSTPLVDEGMASSPFEESDGAGGAGSGARATNLIRS
jgi:hypothetical protein